VGTQWLRKHWEQAITG